MGQGFTSFAPITRAEGVFDRLTGQATQGLNLEAAIDALLQQRAAQADPTLPALINITLQRLLQNTPGGGGGGFDLGAAVGGDFSTAQPPNPITLGAGTGSPFDIPIQTAQPLRESTRLDEAIASGSGLINDIGAFLENPFRFPGGDLSQFLNPPPAPQAAPEQQAQPAVQPPPPPPDLRPPSLVGSFRHGTNFVPQTGLAEVHQGEAIIPANQNPAAAPTPSTGDIDARIAPGALPPPIQAPLNPLQTSINTLQGLTTSGGPITPDIQQILQTQVREQQDALLQNTLRGTREDFGARGLGLSGVEANAELQGRLASNANILGANQNIALNAATQNFGSTLGAAGQLGQTSLGAGQLGLQNAQFQQATQNSILDMLSQLLNQSFSTPEQFASTRPSQVALV